jgi:hypothetical protein
MMKLSGFICGPRIYQYKGWLFEYGYLGPWPLRKNLEPRKRCGHTFMEIFSDWYDLGETVRESFRVGGGCREF